MLKSYYWDVPKTLICHQVSFGELQLTEISLNYKTSCCNLKSDAWEQNCVAFYYFNFEQSYDVLKSKSSCILLNKNINFNKNEVESKMENPTHSFRETNVVLKLIQESEIKSKTDELELAKEKRRHFLYRLFCPNFFLLLKICVISQFVVCWIYFRNIHTFTYQKNITSYSFVACF